MVTSTPAVDQGVEPDAPTKLRRAVTGPLLFVFILGDVVGAGVYALTGELAGKAGGAIWAPLLVALALALLTAGSYAELVTKYPRAGGSAVYAEKAFGGVVSSLVGFTMVAAGVVSAAGLALALAGDYLATFVDLPRIPAAIGFLLLVAAVNARGIRESLRSNLVMTMIEISGLLLVIVVASVFLGGGGGDLGRLGQLPDGVTPAVAVFGGAILAYYSFLGFETSANIAEEVRNPSRTYPRALFGGIAAAGLVYLGVALASGAVLPADQLAGSSGPLLDVVEATGVGVPAWLFSAIALVAVGNGALLTMIMASRMTYGLAEQGLIPSVFGRVLPNRKTPWVAILSTTIVAAALTFVGDLETLASAVVLLLLFVFLSTNLAVLVLRKDRVRHRHFKVWTVLPVLGIGSCVLLLTQQKPSIWLFAAFVAALGAALVLVMRLTHRDRPAGSGQDRGEADQD